MRKLYKIFTVLFALTLLLNVVGCADEKQSTITDGSHKYSDFYEGIDLDIVEAYFVKDNATDYSIVIPENSTEAEFQAASELQLYTQQTTGVIVPIVTDNGKSFSAQNMYFSVGRTTILQQANLKTDYNSLNFDGFVLKTLGKTVVLDAFRDRGFLYGVYDFLERILDIRFFTPDETYVPVLTEVPVYKMDIKSVPAFPMRAYLNGTTFAGIADEAYTSHSRTNSSWTDLSAKYGGKSNMWGRGTDHNMHLYVPEEDYRETHPEFFIDDSNVYGPLTLIDITNGITEDGKLDESMDVSVVKVVIEEMKKDILANPDIDYFVFEQEDGIDLVKDETLIEKYTAAGVLVRFCNVLATELQKWADSELDGRRVNIVTFAYQQTRFPPVKVNPQGRAVPIDPTCVAVENLIIRLALNGNSYYSLFDDRQIDDIKSILDGWKVCAKHFMFWAYDIAFHDYFNYFPSLHAAYDNVQGFRELGVSYIMVQGPHNSSTNWQSNLRHYVYTKLFWNPDQDVSRLVDEYLTAYYGIAAQYVWQFMTLLDTHYAIIVKDNPKLILSSKNEFGTTKYLNVTLLESAISVIEQGENAVLNSDLSEQRKEKLLSRLSGVKVTPLWMYLNNYTDFFPTAESTKKTELALKFFAACDHAKVTIYNEVTTVSALKSKFHIE